MKVNIFVEDMYFLQYIGCSTVARVLHHSLSLRGSAEYSYNAFGGDFDVVHYHSFGPYALLNKALCRGVSILTAHSTPRVNENNLAFSAYFNRLYPGIYRSFDHIITISEACQKEITAMLPDVPTTFIPNGVDRSFFKCDPRKRALGRERYGIPPEAKVILTVAQQTPRKGIYDVMALAKEHPEVYWMWVGGFPYEFLSSDYFQIQKRKKNCDGNIIFTGFVPDIVEIYSTADVFLMPSYAETFGLVILEALSSGLPVVARDITEFREIFGDNVIYFRTRQEAAERISDDTTLASHKHSARSSTEHFDINRVAALHETLYRTLAELNG
jgi:1,2-diacylglycerol-3-alpha-glucose alpha-1,2-galactosyltransferase